MRALPKLSIACFVTVMAAAGLAPAHAADTPGTGMKFTLNGVLEVPPVSTSASGSGTITVRADRTVSGSITTSGIAATAAHIHEAAPSSNGPVIIPLTRTADNVWSVPAGAKLSDAQYDAFKAGKLYVNVHSAAHKDGEIRGQIWP